MSGSIQTAIGKRGKGYKGGRVNSNPITTENSTAEVALDIGKFVKAGTTGHTVLTAIADSIAGVVLKSDAFDGVSVSAKDAITLIKRGEVFVYCETACTKGASPHVRCLANGALEVGDVRNVADGVNTVELTSAVFSETLTGAGLVALELK